MQGFCLLLNSNIYFTFCVLYIDYILCNISKMNTFFPLETHLNLSSIILRQTFKFCCSAWIKGCPTLSGDELTFENLFYASKYRYLPLFFYHQRQNISNMIFSVFKYLNNKMGFLAAYVLMKKVVIEKKRIFCINQSFN